MKGNSLWRHSYNTFKDSMPPYTIGSIITHDSVSHKYVALSLCDLGSLSEKCLHSPWFLCNIRCICSCCYFVSQVSFSQPSHTINPRVLSCRDTSEFKIMVSFHCRILDTTQRRSLQHPLDGTENLLPNLDWAQGEWGVNLNLSEDMILYDRHSHVFTYCLWSSPPQWYAGMPRRFICDK